MGRRRVLVEWAAVAISFGWLAAVCAGQATETISQRILATNTAALRKQVGHEATVVGRISRTGQSKSGMQFLNFADSEFTVVCPEEDVAKFSEGVPVEAYRGQDVEITGTVELYRGKVQIRLREPSQIQYGRIVSTRTRNANLVAAQVPTRSRSGRSAKMCG